MIKTHIIDGAGRGQAARVEDNGLLVNLLPGPPFLPQKCRIFRQYLTDDGLAAGTFDMKVDGSSTNVPYWVPADTDDDRHITTLSFVIADASATLNKFGNITALTNGCRLFYTDSTGAEVDIHDALKSNWDFVRLCLGSPGFGDAAGAFRANNVVGTSEGYIPVVDLTRFMPPYGIKLDKGSQQKITLTVRDDTTGVDGFDCIAYGFERFE